MKSRDRRFTIAFYNLENLFDTLDNPHTHDDDYTPGSSLRWSDKRLARKLNKLSTSISRIGLGFTSAPPVILGVSEVENRFLLEELIQRPLLKKHGYRLVHFDSPDSRGMDTALLYMESAFEPLAREALPVRYKDEQGEIEHSRDILFVEGLLFGSRIELYVNHWPSRREGVEESSPHRQRAADILLEHYNRRLESLENPEGQFTVVMGDLNDRPKDPAPRMITGSGWFQNPFDAIASKGLGTLSHRGHWYLFDQIMLSNVFFEPNPHFAFVKARIFNPRFLGQYRGRFKGHPFRTYAAGRYKGGYSDHFPVFVVLDRLHGSLRPELN